MQVVFVFIVGVIAAWLAGIAWRRWSAAQHEAQREYALLQFADRFDDLEPIFLTAAAATGKPRGLNWERCQLAQPALFAIDQASQELVAFVPATISFSAIPGGDMEDVEAVGNLRGGTAIFIYRDGEWTTDGRAVFNLEPEQAIERYQGSLSRWPTPATQD